MPRICIGNAKECRCKKRAETLFKQVSNDLFKQSKAACESVENADDLQTASDFVKAMNMTESEMINRYGYDPDKTNEIGIETGAKNEKIVLFGLLVLVVLIVILLIQ